MSIKENIVYGNDKASDDKIREVAEIANALQFIESFEDEKEANIEIKKLKGIINKLKQTNQELERLLEKKDKLLDKAFQDVIQDGNIKKSKDIILNTIWILEQQHIKDYLNGEKILNQYEKEIQQAIEQNKMMFDLQTVIDYVRRKDSQTKVNTTD
ncbi:UNKNOWN [Stylonychia lemnae]|uniref:Uncharacterized protein n=1 Tax=Stylonychia lemnae TaxID=5949 RepID=A0A078AX03_STYLE|nr:UNKNOWN [Stylonychia lemnae]|eukprot:CDW85323.1 UNKNOWN [Stylonychia lemnae]